VWREGQAKRVWIYRLLMAGSIEEKVLQRQLAKQGLSEALVDDVGQEVGGPDSCQPVSPSASGLHLLALLLAGTNFWKQHRLGQWLNCWCTGDSNV
jgi:hypothetical protein